MHMSDALLTPAVGGAFWAASAGIMAYSVKKIKEENDESLVPFMGVMSAFVFAAQMINISIPGTGSSGHLGGGLLLAIFLGPHRAFISIASILLVQALFFADGGLMALGTNIFNIGFAGGYIGYLLIWRPLAGNGSSAARLGAATILSGVAVLEIGAFGVVLQTVFSGISDLPFLTFSMFMLPVHFAIGIVEGLVTLGIIMFVKNVRPELLNMDPSRGKAAVSKGVLLSFLLAAVLTGGFFSWYASSNPDGLEWSIGKTSEKGELEESEEGIRGIINSIVKKAAVFPDYAFKADDRNQTSPALEKGGTSLSGVIGIIIVFILAAGLGVAFRRKKKNPL